jgi:hypothetical protein
MTAHWNLAYTRAVTIEMYPSLHILGNVDKMGMNNSTMKVARKHWIFNMNAGCMCIIFAK